MRWGGKLCDRAHVTPEQTRCRVFQRNMRFCGVWLATWRRGSDSPHPPAMRRCVREAEGSARELTAVSVALEPYFLRRPGRLPTVRPTVNVESVRHCPA